MKPIRAIRVLAIGTLALSIVVCLASGVRAQDVSFRRGDANADGKRDISDPVHTLQFLFSGGAEPACWKASDSNDDGALDLSDAVHTLGFLFLGSASPPPPFPGCGTDPTTDDLGCAAYAPCVDAPVWANIQVDAELEDTVGLQRIVALLEERGIATTVFVTAEYANRNALLVTDLFQRGHEIALHGYYTGEQLASMTYEEQKDLLTRAKKALEGCQPCGTFKPIVGFRPQYFSQNEDTFRVLDEIGCTHNSGFKARQLFLPGHEWDCAPYAVEGHAFAAVPLSTVPLGEDRAYICDIACANVLKLTGAQWRDLLMAGLDQSLREREPIVVLLHGWYTGDTDLYDYYQPFVDFLDAAAGKVQFVSTQGLVDACGP